jgi:Pilus formation protein N terminal region
MTRRTLILTASLVAAIAAVGFVATDRPRAAELNVAPSGPAPGMYVISSDATANFLPLVVNKSVVIELTSDIKDVLVSSPAIVNAVVRTKRRAYIIGVAAGQTDVYFFDAGGRQIGALNIDVTPDPTPAPFVGNPEPQIEVTVFRGDTRPTSLHCNPTNCTAPANALPALPPGYTDTTIHNK